MTGPLPILCGALVGDGFLCRIPAGPDHDHEAWVRERLADGVDLVEDMQAASDPVPGLYRTLTGKALPSFAELRERHGDPANLKPIPTTVCTGTKTCHRVDPHHHKADGSTISTQQVDFREMLRDDPGAIMLRDRLGHVLQRPYLATQLVEALPREVAARLADRLESLVHQAVEVATAQISTAVTHEVVVAIERLDAETAAKLREVRRERFTTPSRFS